MSHAWCYFNTWDISFSGQQLTEMSVLLVLPGYWGPVFELNRSGVWLGIWSESVVPAVLFMAM